MGNWECYILDSKILFCCPVVPYMFNLCMKVVRNPQISGGDTGKEGGGGEKECKSAKEEAAYDESSKLWKCKTAI